MRLPPHRKRRLTANILSWDSLSPGRDLEGYIQTVSALPVLSAEEERALAERFYYENDLEAARELILCHLRFVVHLARGYSGYGLPQADLVQEGNVGLMRRSAMSAAMLTRPMITVVE